MLDIKDEVKAAVEAVSPVLADSRPRAAIITGSGLGGVIARGTLRASMKFEGVPGLPAPAVPGHGSTIGVIELNGKAFLFFGGRAHLYEGHSPASLGMAVRIAAALGVRTLVSACAVGALRPEFNPGCIVVVRDHLNMAGCNPYSPELSTEALRRAGELGIGVSTGVYAWVSGPSYETPAEARMLATLGADVVGMSLLPETLTAAQLGLRVLAFACVTNPAPGTDAGGDYISHEDVLSQAGAMVEPLGLLLESLAPSVAG